MLGFYFENKWGVNFKFINNQDGLHMQIILQLIINILYFVKVHPLIFSLV
jgi:hypothetical protein